MINYYKKYLKYKQKYIELKKGAGIYFHKEEDKNIYNVIKSVGYEMEFSNNKIINSDFSIIKKNKEYIINGLYVFNDIFPEAPINIDNISNPSIMKKYNELRQHKESEEHKNNSQCINELHMYDWNYINAYEIEFKKTYEVCSNPIYNNFVGFAKEIDDFFKTFQQLKDSKNNIITLNIKTDKDIKTFNVFHSKQHNKYIITKDKYINDDKFKPQATLCCNTNYEKIYKLLIYISKKGISDGSADAYENILLESVNKHVYNLGNTADNTDIKTFINKHRFFVTIIIYFMHQVIFYLSEITKVTIDKVEKKIVNPETYKKASFGFMLRDSLHNIVKHYTSKNQDTSHINTIKYIKDIYLNIVDKLESYDFYNKTTNMYSALFSIAKEEKSMMQIYNNKASTSFTFQYYYDTLYVDDKPKYYRVFNIKTANKNIDLDTSLKQNIGDKFDTYLCADENKVIYKDYYVDPNSTRITINKSDSFCFEIRMFRDTIPLKYIDTYDSFRLTIEDINKNMSPNKNIDRSCGKNLN